MVIGWVIQHKKTPNNDPMHSHAEQRFILIGTIMHFLISFYY